MWWPNLYKHSSRVHSPKLLCWVSKSSGLINWLRPLKKDWKKTKAPCNPRRKKSKRCCKSWPQCAFSQLRPPYSELRLRHWSQSTSTKEILLNKLSARVLMILIGKSRPGFIGSRKKTLASSASQIGTKAIATNSWGQKKDYVSLPSLTGAILHWPKLWVCSMAALPLALQELVRLKQSRT